MQAAFSRFPERPPATGGGSIRRPRFSSECGPLDKPDALWLQRLWVLLRRDGWLANKTPVCRLYCEEDPGILRRKSRPRKSIRVQATWPPNGLINERWSMDFTADQLVGRQRFRLLPLVGHHSRESLAIEKGRRLTGDEVVACWIKWPHNAARRFESIMAGRSS